MKKFDLKLAKAGHPVCTLDGKPVRIICFDLKDTKYPIVAVVMNGSVETVNQYTNEGEYFGDGLESYNDLMMVSEVEESGIKEAIRYAIAASTHEDGILINGVTESEAIAWLEKQDTKVSVYRDTLFKIATILSQYEDKDDSPLEKIRSIMIDGTICSMDLESKNKKQGEQKPTDEEIKILLQTEYEKGKADAIEAAMKSVTKDKESAIKFLKSAGIMNENGELAKEYVVDNIEQNHAWSEDDEEMFDAIIADIQFTQKTHNHEVNQVVYEREIDWLKSIKDRVQPQPKYEWKQENTDALTDFENVMMHIGISFFGQHAGLNPNDTNEIKKQANILLGLVPQQEWSEEDENRFRNLIYLVEHNEKSKGTKQGFIDFLNRLKSLKDKVQPQQEWSEEDEKMLHWLCRIVHSQRVGKVITLREESELGEWMDKWLNHNPQNTWKPSDEQIQALEYQVHSTYKGSWQYRASKELLEQLKKL